MSQLYFIRHGESEANASKIWSPYNSPLTDLGRWQASAAGADARQRGLQFDLIVCSPLPRAQETARLIAEEVDHASPVEVLPLLAERDWGTLAGQPEEHYFAAGGTFEGLNAVDGVEHIQDLQKRAADALADMRQRKAQNILLVGHGDFGRAFLREIAGQPYTEEYARPLDEQQLPHARFVHAHPAE
jgi:broad specificity phosphatase PhoE